MAENLFIQLIAKLNKALSKAQIQTDIRDIEKTPFYVRLTGRLNRSLTRRNIESDAQNAARNVNIDINARVSERELQRSFDEARQTLETSVQNNPIEIPVDVNTNGVQQGQQQVERQARGFRGILGDYLSAQTIFNKITEAIKKAVEEVKALNKAQTDLQIVTQKSASEMKALMQDYNQLAKDMGATTLEVTDGANEWLRQGKSISDTNELIRDSMILSKISSMESSEATKYLTSAMHGYKTEVKDVIGIVDKLNAVDLASASDAAGLAESLSKCANSANIAGISMDTLIAYIATVSEVTQKSASTVGEGFKSITARLNNIKIGNFLDEDGTDITSDINDAERTLSKFNIAIRDNAKEFRDAQDIIKDVASEWENMSSVEQSAVAKAFGGTYQRENVVVLFENFNRVLELTEVSANSAGTAMEKFSIYEQSLEAATNRLTASLESLAYNTIDSEFLTGLTNATAGIVEFIDKTQLLKTGLTAGIFTGVISGLVVLGAKMVAVKNNVVQFTQAMALSRQITTLSQSQYTTLRNAVNGLTEAQLRCVLSSRQLNEQDRLNLMQAAGIEQSRQRQLLQTWNLTNAENAQTAATFSLRGAWEGLKASIAANPIGLIVTALTIATTAIMTYNQKQEEARQAAIDSANALTEQEKAIEDLRQQYINILDSEKSASEKTQELNKWKQELVETYGFEKEALKDLNTEREKGLELLDEEIKRQNRDSRGEWLGKNESQIKTAQGKINNTNDSTKTDGRVSTSLFNNIDANEVRESVKDLFGNVYELGAGDNWQFEVNGDNLIEKYENIQKIITQLGNSKNLNRSEENLLDALNKESDNIKKVLDEYQDIYETYYEFTAQNNFEDYTANNPVENVGKDNYLSWKKGLLKSANGDKQLENELSEIAAEKFSALEDYYNNLDNAKTMFVEGKFNSKPISDFIKSLSDEDLEILIQFDENIFDKGIEGVEQAIADFKKNNPIEAEVDTKSLDELKKAYEELSKSADSFVKNKKSVTTALEEQEKHGQLSADSIQSLIEAGYAQALMYDETTGAVTLNKQAVEQLNQQKREEIRLDAIRQKSDLKKLYQDEIDKINEKADAMRFVTAEARKQFILGEMNQNQTVKDIEEQLAGYDGLTKSLNAPTFDDKSSDDPWKDKFDKLYSKWQHDLEMNKVTQEEYINWLDEAYKEYFSDLTKYQDEYNKYEEEVYKYRLEREQDLFDKKIDNYEKLADKALDKYVDGDGNDLTVTASFDYAREQISAAITETQNRINELSMKTGFEDEIDSLRSDLEGLYDTLSDINKQEIESQKEYISSLKDEYSDLMDEQINEQKKLADETEKSYESRINAIDKQIDAVNKVNEAEERQKKILEAQKELREASIKNRIVLTNNGWEARADDEAVKEAQENLKNAYEDEQIARLEEQKELLETQKDESKAYYDKVVEDLENQKTAREKQYDILVDIYEKLGGEKKQTSLNDGLVSKLTKSGDINKAVQNLSPNEMKQAITSGLLTTDSKGNYTIDYSILDNNSAAVKDNTDALNGVTNTLNQFIPETAKTDNINTDGTVTAGGFNLVADEKGKLTKKPVMVDGKQVEGQKIRPITKSEWGNKNIIPIGDVDLSAIQNSGLKEFVQKALTWGSGLNQSMPIIPKITQNVKAAEDTLPILQPNIPNFSCTVNIEGNADEKTVQAFKTELHNELCEYTDQLYNSLHNSFIRQKNKI